MKKLILILVFALGVIFTSQAQKREKRVHKQFTPEQKLQLAIKNMTLNLDLENHQIQKIKPLIQDQMKERALRHQQRKLNKGKRQKLSKSERFETKMKHLDKKIAFQREMKAILDADQYKMFKRIKYRKKHTLKKKNKKHKHRKNEPA